MLEVQRLLANYVSSAMSLKDHCLAVAGRYRLRGKLEPQIAAAKDDPLSRFVQDLRAYMVHYRYPDVLICLTTNRFEIQVHQLVATNNKWSPRAREYMGAANDGIGIVSTMKAHRDFIQTFARQLWHIGRRGYEEDYKAIEKFREEMEHMTASKV